MSYKLKEIDIKYRTSYFFDDMINIRNFDPNKIKIHEMSDKNIFIYHMRYVMVKDLCYATTNSVMPFYKPHYTLL